ncbi:YgjV family protein [Candidatus Saccharibacteria bacterium]|nr:YgjV family protein [Candidatus Saccharibacteria bacterium]
MMQTLLLANFIALAAAIIMALSGLAKSPKKLVAIQSINVILSIISNLLLQSYPGAIINTISLLRNLIFLKTGQISAITKILLSCMILYFGLTFNNLALIGILPILSSLSYLWLIDTKNKITFRRLNIISSLLWFVHDLYVLAFTAAIFDFAAVLTNSYTLSRLPSPKSPHSHKP